MTPTEPPAPRRLERHGSKRHRVAKLIVACLARSRYGQHSRPWHVRIQKSDSRNARGSEVPTPAAAASAASAASTSATDARLRSKVCSRISTPPRARASPARGSGGTIRCPFFCEAGSSAKARQPSASCIAQKRPPHGESCGSRDGAPPLGAASPLAADRVHA
eukprot:scaffold27404_cov43-Phaeocystis_antarctica.AAC.1